VANPAQPSSAPPLFQRSHAVLPQHGSGGRLIPAPPPSPAIPAPPTPPTPPAPPALPSFLKRPTGCWARGCLIAVNLAAVTFFLLSYSRRGVSFGPYRIDLNVYRIGSAVWLRGGDLYGVLPPTSSGARLPFSYPPIAAVLLAPLALVPMPVAVTLLTTVTIALTALVLRIFLRSVSASPTTVSARPTTPRSPAASPDLPRAPSAVSSAMPNASWWTVLWLLPATLFLEPVRNTLSYGQVNVALMALVSADCLVAAPRWPRGALVGIAAAVKLTPAAFVLYFLLRRDWRAAVLAALSFCACAGIGFLLAWHASVEYWTSVIDQTSRAGSPAYAANQSIQGVLARAGLDPRSVAGTVTWLVLSAGVVALACLGMRTAIAASADAWALSLNAFAGLLISPISWSHHWVWGETAVLTLAILGWRGLARDRRHDTMEHPGLTGRPGGAGLMAGRLCLAFAVAGAVLFAVSPQWWFPSGGSRELHWAAWEQAVGSSYVIFAAVVLLAAAWRPRQRPEKLRLTRRASALRPRRTGWSPGPGRAPLPVGTGGAGDHQR
jgi:alpha-1,2-mannosyltransferase